MVFLAEKYKPTSQKALFHKDIVNQIRKWIVHIQECKNKKQILMCCGPVGSGKTVMINMLFKNFNLIRMDTAEIRVNHSQHEHNIVSYDATTLGKQGKGNIIFLDNIELCDKYIKNFVEHIHGTLDTNVPIIMLCNSPKLKESFVGSCTTIFDIKNPSLLELRKLVEYINIQETLNLSTDCILKIIKISQHDIRQVFNILEQWRLNTLGNFETFYQRLQEKPVDIDLLDKVCYIMDTSKPFNNETTYQLSSSEPMSVSNSLYQNYLLTNSVENASHIMDSISMSNCIFMKIFDEQCWQLYDLYILHACIIPSAHFKSCQEPIPNMFYQLKPYKDVSQNFANSLNELRKVTANNLYTTRFTNPAGRVFSDLLRQTNETQLVSQMCVKNLNVIHAYFETQKRGKNTSKDEKFSICEQIQDQTVLNAIEEIVKVIYSYKLFEVDIDKLLINKKDLDIRKDIDLLELKMFKRFINIFTMKREFVFKSHVELGIKYFVFKKIIEDLTKYQSNIAIDNIELLTQDLCNIWNI